MEPSPSASAFWDAKFEGEDYAYGTAPNAFLASRAHLFRPGHRILVPGDGEGRNGVFLAKQGADVTTLDLSAVAIDKAKRLAHREGVGLNAHRADILNWAWPKGAFDAVVLIFLHMLQEERARLHALAAAALKPGGSILIEGFTPAHRRHQNAHAAAGGPKREDMLFTAEMLGQDFSGLRVSFLEETETTLSEGRLHRGPAAIVRGVFKKTD